MLLSVIIVNYKNRLHLPECLNSVCSVCSEGMPLEIIVVNNDVEDALGEIQEQFPEIMVIHNNQNIGFGRAVNVGAAKAKGEVLLFLNPDAKILTHAMEKLLLEFDIRDRLGIVGPRLVTKENKTQLWSAGEEVTLKSLIGNNLGIVRSKRIWEGLEKRSVHWVSGASMFVRQDVFRRLGGFDERFFMYFEDIDLCRRARKIHKEVLYFPELEVRHVSGGSTLDEKERKRIYYQSQDYYFQKHHGRSKAAVVKLLRRLLA